MGARLSREGEEQTPSHTFQDLVPSPGPNLDLPPHLVTERCQVGRRLLPNSSYLCGRHQSEDVLDRGGRVPPELVPEGVV